MPAAAEKLSISRNCAVVVDFSSRNFRTVAVRIIVAVSKTVASIAGLSVLGFSTKIVFEALNSVTSPSYAWRRPVSRLVTVTQTIVSFGIC
jgi:hypothetical protein